MNEAPYIKDNPITLLSEYQIREYGLIVDSVATKHKVSHDKYGTQRLYINNDLNILFEGIGALMGFEILPIEEGDEDIYETHAITGSMP